MTLPFAGLFSSSSSLVLAFSGNAVTIGRDRGNFLQNEISRAAAQAINLQMFHPAKAPEPK
jgi:hypothetical protein